MKIIQIDEEIIISGKKKQLYGFLKILRDATIRKQINPCSETVEIMVKKLGSMLNIELSRNFANIPGSTFIYFRQRLIGLTDEIMVDIMSKCVTRDEVLNSVTEVTQEFLDNNEHQRLLYRITDCIVNEYLLYPLPIEKRKPEVELDITDTT